MSPEDDGIDAPRVHGKCKSSKSKSKSKVRIKMADIK